MRHNRSLHSRERRIVQEGLFGLVRTERGLVELLGTEAEIALWLGWLVLRGLEPEVADHELPGPWSTLLADWEALGGSGDAVGRLALRHSLPRDLAKRLVRSLGEEGAAAFLTASDRPGPVWIRANRLKCTRDELAERLRADGIDTRTSELVPDGLQIVGRHNLEALAAFREGWFEVQDAGSQKLASLVEPDGPVLDFCAGAGGKSLALAAEGAPVVALDVRGQALEELDRRATRAGAQVEVHRIATQGPLPEPVAFRRFSRVLVDAPCSGTGVLRRHPEHRYLIRRGTVREHAQRQRDILERACPLVEAGGRLVYGTCSVLEEENEQVVEQFLQRHPSFSLRSTTLRVAPHTHGTDGFFGAVLERSAD